jgi:integrase
MARKKGYGSIYQKEKGGSYYLEYTVQGKRKRLSLKVSHMKDKKATDGTVIPGAETKARMLLDDANNAKSKRDVVMFIAEQRGIIKRTFINFEDIWKEFNNRYKRSVAPGTLKNYCNHWSNFKLWLDVNYPRVDDLRHVSVDIAQEYCQYLIDVKKHSASTYNQHRGTLLLIFDVLKDPAGLVENPWENTERRNPRIDTVSRRILSDKDLKMLFEYIGSSEFSFSCQLEWNILFHLGAYTGMRLTDCCCLTKDKILWEKGVIRTTPIKTQRIRRYVTIPIFDPLKKVLEPIIHSISGEYIIPGIAEEYKNAPDTLKHKVVDIFEKAGFETRIEVSGRKKKQSVIGFHSLRGTLTSKLLNSGVPISVVKEIIGDNIKTIEEHYLKTNAEDVVNATSQIKF